MNAKLVRWLFGGVVALSACGSSERSVPEGGSTIHVLFDERHGLEGGELVRLHDFDIGVVESVDLSGGRVRANLSLSSEARENLTIATTFTVEEDSDGRYLEVHILDADADTLGEGATVDGADGRLELMAMRASSTAGKFTDQAGEFVDELKKELDAVNWSEEEHELREQWEQIIDDMDEAAEEGQEQLAKRVDELVKKLQEVGRSDEARELQERFQEFLDGLGEGS
jgi:hypothetical protein